MKGNEVRNILQNDHRSAATTRICSQRKVDLIEENEGKRRGTVGGEKSKYEAFKVCTRAQSIAKD